VTVRNGDDDGDPGAIAEAYFTVEDGAVVLRDADDKHLTSRALLKGQDPLAVAAHCCERWRSLKASIARLAIRSWGSRDPGDTHGQRLRSSENSAKRFGVAPLRSSPGYAGVDNQTSHCWFAEIKLVIAGNYKNLAASTFNHRGEPNIG
jgi:hypothetical protein